MPSDGSSAAPSRRPSNWTSPADNAYRGVVKLTGDPQALAALKAMHQKNAGFMKALMEDARTTTDKTTFFRGEDGTKYRLRVLPDSGDLEVTAVEHG